MVENITFDYGGLKYYLKCCDENREAVNKMIKNLNSGGFAELMAYILKEQIRCKVEAVSSGDRFVERAERYNKLYISAGIHLGN